MRKERRKSNGRARPVQPKIFSTMEEVTSFYFPKIQKEARIVKGKEQGAQVAEHTLVEVSRSARV
jgi:hypothetical protein